MNYIKNSTGFTLADSCVSFDFDSKYAFERDGEICRLTLTGDAPIPKLRASDRLILPVDEGIAIRVDREYEKGELDINNIGRSFCSRQGTMSMIIIERDDRFLLIALDSGLDAFYSVKWDGSRHSLSITCTAERTVSYAICPSLAKACKCYREIKKLAPITLAQKLRCNPEIAKLIGGGIFWVWSDNYNEVMYADHDTDLSPAVTDKLLDVADNLHSAGVDRAMFGLFFDEDSHLSGPLYERYGYISTQYDNYNDVLNPEMLDLIPKNRYKNCGYTRRRTIDYPDGVQRTSSGEMFTAWALMGLDGEYHTQNTLCPRVALERMKEEIPQIIADYPHYKGRFIDVFGGGVSSCYADAHPMTLDECLEIKKSAFEFLGSIGLIAGTEDGFEELADSLVYAEGLHSPVYFRIEDAGRNHAKVYSEDSERHIERHMLDPECRVPLWELVYHDSVMAFPYWGDSTESSIRLTHKKVLFAGLYGCPPLYSFSLADFPSLRERIIESYRQISAIHEKVALLPMSDYVVLSDDRLVQKTVFGDRYEVVANFSDEEYEYHGQRIKPCSLYFGEL